MAYEKNYSNSDNNYDRGNDRGGNRYNDRNQDRHSDRNNESLYSKRIKAGKRRTYFFDVRATKGNDYFITITESKKRFDDNGYERHKMFLYKEDFNKFLAALEDTITYVKTDLMPDFDFDAFNHDNEFDPENPGEYTPREQNRPSYSNTEMPAAEASTSTTEEAPSAETEQPSTVASNNDESSIDEWKI